MVLIESDLDIEVDGSHAHLGHDGGALVLRSSDPATLLAAVRRDVVRRSGRPVAALADEMAALGTSLRVEGPHGPILTVGSAAEAPLIGVLTGTRHIAPGSLRASVTLLRVGTGVAGRRSAGLVAAAAIGAVVAARRLARLRRRRTADPS